MALSCVFVFIRHDCLSLSLPRQDFFLNLQQPGRVGREKAQTSVSVRVSCDQTIPSLCRWRLGAEVVDNEHLFCCSSAHESILVSTPAASTLVFEQTLREHWQMGYRFAMLTEGRNRISMARSPRLVCLIAWFIVGYTSRRSSELGF